VAQGATPEGATPKGATSEDKTAAPPNELFWSADDPVIQELPEAVRSRALDLYNRGLLPAYELFWSADNSTIQALPEAVHSFTLELYNRGLLPVRYIDAPAEQVGMSVVFQNEFPYLTWDDTTASLFCDLNKDRCERPRGTVLPPDDRESQEHLLGTPVSPAAAANWTFAPVPPGESGNGEEVKGLAVPNVTFSQDVNWRTFDVPAGTSVSEVYAERALGCEGLQQASKPFVFDGQFQDLVAELAVSSGACARDIFSRNYGHFQYLLWAAPFGAATSPTEARETIDGRMKAFEQRLNAAKDPWPELDSIAEEIRQAAGQDALPVTLPVFSLEARLSPGSLIAATAADRSDRPPEPRPSGALGALVSAAEQELRWINRAGAVGSTLTAIAAERSDVSVRVTVPDSVGSGNALVLDNHDQQEELSGLAADALVSHLVREMPMNSLAQSQHKVLARQRENLFAHVNYPWHGGMEFEGFQRLVVIVDEGFVEDMSHCIFAKLPGQASCDLHAPILTPATAGDAQLPSVGAAVAGFHQNGPDGRHGGDSHGHAVASIAAARPSSGTMLGIDPGAFAVPFEVDLNHAEQALGSGQVRHEVEATRQRLSDGKYYSQSINWLGVVWNLSFHLVDLSNQAPVMGIREYAGDVSRNAASAGALEYFVFAAGNVPEAITVADLEEFDACRVFPACFATEDPTGTMIAVVGAQIKDGIAELWTDGEVGSYAYPAFQVAAIARDVPISLTEPNAFTLDSGTSYAAPQVAALVAAMRAAGVNEPTLLMGRLMACARMTRPLAGKVLGGLIDVDCSLTLDRAQLAIENGDPKYLDLRPGQLIQIWNAASDPNDPDGFVAGGLPPLSGKLDLEFPRAQPDKDLASLGGFRSFKDDLQQINIVGWDDRPTTDPLGPRGHAKVLAENRGRIQSNVMIEFQFDGEPGTVCARLYQVTQFIPEDPASKKDLRVADGPGCTNDPPHPRRDFGNGQ
jgi:hypothetical protein